MLIHNYNSHCQNIQRIHSQDIIQHKVHMKVRYLFLIVNFHYSTVATHKFNTHSV